MFFAFFLRGVKIWKSKNYNLLWRFNDFLNFRWTNYRDGFMIFWMFNATNYRDVFLQYSFFFLLVFHFFLFLFLFSFFLASATSCPIGSLRFARGFKQKVLRYVALRLIWALCFARGFIKSACYLRGFNFFPRITNSWKSMVDFLPPKKEIVFFLPSAVNYRFINSLWPKFQEFLGTFFSQNTPDFENCSSILIFIKIREPFLIRK